MIPIMISNNSVINLTWIPLLSKVAGNRGFSEACPQPGHTASTFCLTAMSTIKSTLA